MADLKKKKKKTSPLPWIIGALVVIAILFFLFRGSGDTDNLNSDSRDTLNTNNGVIDTPR